MISTKRPAKRAKVEDLLPFGFLDPLPGPAPVPVATAAARCRQFWKAGDYDGPPQAEDSASSSAGMDHVRVHPKFLHSNATSHKWALGALAELLDNALDEVCNGATFVNVDTLENKKGRSKMLLVEDNGGGINPDKMRQCMSLGYSTKSKSTNTIGQYGNGFKTSTMRLGADVIVFSRCSGKDGESPTQSIGMLSYTFLTSTGKEDIVVPIVDYERREQGWSMLTRTSAESWSNNLDTIIQWSPYSSEADLLQQFNSMTDQGTRIVIYNLWEDDEGELELDFVADEHDIQIRGVNRDEKKIEMAKKFPNSCHFLTYRHSLRSYASILYLRLPPSFRMILRGKEIEHHNIIDDMMMKTEVIYRPQTFAYGPSKDPNMCVVVNLGFAKDAKDHIDIQGFNVYHKNRLIKPFWRVWNAAGSGGRGVIGVLEANFIKPAHDKQDFERTTVFTRLEARLNWIQKNYWKDNCDRIGYAAKRKKSTNELDDRESPENLSSKNNPNHNCSSRNVSPNNDDKLNDFGKCQIPKKVYSHSNYHNVEKCGGTRHKDSADTAESGNVSHIPSARRKESQNFTNGNYVEVKNTDNCRMAEACTSNGGTQIAKIPRGYNAEVQDTKNIKFNGDGASRTDSSLRIEQLTSQNEALKNRIKEIEQLSMKERDRTKLLAAKLEEAEQLVEKLTKEQEALLDIFAEERCRRDSEEERLRKKLEDATAAIRELVKKNSTVSNVKLEH
ncbi:protein MICRORCHIDIA 4-like [Ananas comosus]|uniref:Protein MICRORCHIDIA 4-like n=1 Tax=Ananas comosus TaxID=4615 RepID=A0A6P5EXV9_ANACO|nr:protein MICRORCHIDIA 4-like [Ananas comosus]